MPPEPRSRIPLGGNGPLIRGLERPGSSRQPQHVMCHECLLVVTRHAAGVRIVHTVTRGGNRKTPTFLQDCRARLGAKEPPAREGQKVTWRVRAFLRLCSRSGPNGHISGWMPGRPRSVFPRIFRQSGVGRLAYWYLPRMAWGRFSQAAGQGASGPKRWRQSNRRDAVGG